MNLLHFIQAGGNTDALLQKGLERMDKEMREEMSFATNALKERFEAVKAQVDPVLKQAVKAYGENSGLEQITEDLLRVQRLQKEQLGLKKSLEEEKSVLKQMETTTTKLDPHFKNFNKAVKQLEHPLEDPLKELGLRVAQNVVNRREHD